MRISVAAAAPTVAAMKGRVVLDLRNVWDPEAMRAAGFDYRSIGRP